MEVGDQEASVVPVPSNVVRFVKPVVDCTVTPVGRRRIEANRRDLAQPSP